MTHSRRLVFTALLFLVVALALRASTFGDPDRQVDEAFYWLVGQRLHAGAIPYVTVWDRKPFGLFAIYGALATLGTSVWIYQIAACAAAALTAWLISRLVARLAGEGQGGQAGGIAAGLAYLVTLLPFEGDSGQAPDFYNPLIAAAMLLVVGQRAELARGRARASVWLAMLLCGFAIIVKQTALFESAFLGLWTCAMLCAARVALSRLLARALGFAALGALPMLAVAAGYALIGHWPEFWHAMVLSNLAKARVGGEAWRLVGIGLRIAPLALLALAGLVANPPARRFTALWLLAALTGFLAVPNFYGHYLLPVLVPLSVAAGLLLARTMRRWLLIALIAAWALFWESPPPRAQALETARALDDMAAWTRAHDPGGGLLVLDGPPLLYLAARERFLSPLVFPNHLDHAIEANVSHLDTAAELNRVLARAPGVIVVAQTPRNQPINARSYAAINAYIAAHCHARHAAPAIGRYADNPIILSGDCR